MAIRPERPFADRRRLAGLTLERAARLIGGISPRWLRALERNTAPLCQSLAVRMADAYGCTVQALVTPVASRRDRGCEGAERERPPRSCRMSGRGPRP